jgi:hypothetical protein
MDYKRIGKFMNPKINKPEKNWKINKPKKNGKLMNLKY